MKKILLLALSVFVFIACDKDDSPEDILKAKLVGEWEEYGYYWINKGINKPNDTTFMSYGKDHWLFTSTTVTLTDSWDKEPYSINGDSLFVNKWSRHIKFQGDSCILTSGWGGTSNHVKYIEVLYPKGYKK